MEWALTDSNRRPLSLIHISKPLSGSRIDHSFTGHQSVNKGRQAIYGKLCWEKQLPVNGLPALIDGLAVSYTHLS